ncbi:MAG: hypothetical protein CTY25_12025 [Methylobacterium sp.]|nr:MAG: hypothetical protein CTY25_12025 [Methylobacterium sp.]
MSVVWPVIILFTFVAGGDIDRRGKMTCQALDHVISCEDGSVFRKERTINYYFDNRGNSWETDNTGVTRYSLHWARLGNEVRPFNERGFAFYFEWDPNVKNRGQIIDNRGNRWEIEGNELKDPLGRRWRVSIDRFSVLTFERVLA